MSIILLYHRVTEPETDPQRLCVSPRRFKEHMAVIKAQFQPVSMKDLSDGILHGALPDNGVAVTFDDGYKDNYCQALPILSRYRIPAAFYVTAGLIDRQAEFWWDAVEYLLLHPHDLPPRFHAVTDDGEISFALGASARYSRTEFEALRHWHIFDHAVTPRQAAYLKLCEFIRPLMLDRQQIILQRLCDWAGLPFPARKSHQAVTADQLSRMANIPNTEIGCHAMTHTVLSQYDLDGQRDEIDKSRGIIEDIIQRTVKGFSYPFGAVQDFNEDTLRILKEDNYSYACANFTGKVGYDSDPFQLPRMIVRNWDGKTFADYLHQWIHSET